MQGDGGHNAVHHVFGQGAAQTHQAFVARGAVHHQLLAVGAPVADECHGVRRRHVPHGAATAQDLAHALGAGHKGQRRGFLVFAFDEQPGGVADRGVMDFDQDVVRPKGVGLGHVLHGDHRFRWAEFTADDGFHGGVFHAVQTVRRVQTATT